MFSSPYQTTACSAYQHQVPAIQSALKRALIHDDLAPAESLKGTKFPGVYMVPPHAKEVPNFTMPIEFESPNGLAVAVDIRGLVKSTGESSFKIQAPAEYAGLVLRGALTLGWLKGDQSTMRRFNDLAAKVFVRLLSESLVRRLGLSPYDQPAVVVVCGLFYYCNFIDGKQAVSKAEKDKIAVAVARLSRIAPNTVAEILEQELPPIQSLDSFCDALRAVLNNPRLENVNAAFIMTLMGGLWYGGNARQIMAVALEYPPVWLSLIYQAVDDRSFSGAGLTKMVDTENRNNAARAFSLDVAQYLEQLSDE
ncbi:hypothetical protein LUCX_29 [Xanthomonas phage vB_XciM_LucasX]|nr:hypothetical protein LUCX_29 [Xanthomonas phage vB_XciM_LucasX]